MPLIETKGAASAQGFGEFAASSGSVTYIEDVFSTYLYTGNSSTQTITNGIDLSTKGGLVWLKARSQTYDNLLNDSATGPDLFLSSNTTGALSSVTALSSFTTSGFVLPSYVLSNQSGTTYASWTFRKQPKFFDVVTYTGTGANRTVAHSLGSVPGCMIIKRTNAATDWQVYHQSLANTQYMLLDLTNTVATGTTRWNSTTPTSTVFSLGTDASVNASGGSYVAYLFASNAGGFGITGTENVISCGSYTGTGSAGNYISLGYEAQWVLIRRTNALQDWFIFDNMRGMCSVGSGNTDPYLNPNQSAAESGGGDYVGATSTGFVLKNGASALNASGGNYIYIAIRRGPMKVPTSGTSVFNPVLGVSTAPAFRSSNFNSGVDSAINFYKPGYSGYARWSSRLTGTGVIPTSGTDAESAVTYNTFDYMNGFYNLAGLDTDFGAWMFKRAPSFFDEVCYNGTSATTAFNHNLSVAPELIIVKRRNGVATWPVGTLFTASTCKELTLDTTNSATNSTYSDYFGGQPTSTTFTMASSTGGNLSGSTYVAYLFASCPGVSKVGSYTGTGTTLQVDCGFTGGARFVLIKRTDSTGDWYVWDSARGIVSGNDPYLLLNSTAAEVTNTDYVDTYSAGFEISSTAPAAINASGGTFIFLAIA